MYVQGLACVQPLRMAGKEGDECTKGKIWPGYALLQQTADAKDLAGALIWRCLASALHQTRINIFLT